MSFGKLLASGKSFVNGRSKPAYREDKRAYLPKFGSPKNPFSAPVQTELPKEEAKQSAAPRAKVAASVKPPQNPGPTKSLPSWTRKLNPVSVWRESQEMAKRPPPPAIQAELSLDTVKVVHNDLSDADVEIVPLKSRSPQGDAPELQPAKKAWEILGERLMRATAL